jgi:hypothetical protein
MARILQFNFEDKDLVYLDRVSGVDIVNLARELHCDTIVLFARDAWGRAYYESRIARKTTRLGNRDLLREVISEAKKYRIKVFVMVGHTTNPELFSEHPEWAQRSFNGEVIHMDTDPRLERGSPLRWPLMCLNSPFLEMVVKEVEEVLEYGVDGILLDSFRYMPDFERACYCEYCKTKHRDVLNRDLPVVEDWSSRAYRESFLWRYSVNVKAIEKIWRSIKERSPHVALVYNNHPAGWKGRANTIVELSRNFIDIVFAEASEVDYQPPGFLAEIVKLTKALSGGKRVWATRNAFHMALTTTSTTPIVIKQGIREIFAAGGDPMVLVFSSTFVQSHMFKQPVREVFEEIEKLEEFMQGVKRIRYVGVVYSNRSRDWAGQSDPRHVTDEIRGFYYSLVYNGLPVDFVVDTQLDSGDIYDYKVLVLANTASLSERSIKYISEYANSGGGLVATYLTSMMNDQGDLLEDFQLRDVLGVSFKGLLKYPWSYIVLEKEHQVTSGLGDKVILWGDYDRVFRERRTPPSIAWHTLIEPMRDVDVLGYIAEPQSEFGYEYENGRSPPLMGCLTRAPAIVVSSKEKKVVYYTGQLGRLYWRLGLPQYEQLILNSIKWCGGEPPVKIITKGIVLVEPYERKGQLIIHLVNLTFDKRIIVRGNTDDPTMWYSTAESVWPPRSTIPLEVLVEVKGYEIKKAWSPLEQRNYELERRNDATTLSIKLDEYELLILETS